MTQKGLLDLFLRHCEADLGPVFVLSLVPECKGIVHKQPFVERDTCFALLRELKPKFSGKSERV